VPMAIALGYGVLFAAVVTLFLVPCGYVMLDDLLGRRGEAVPESALGAGAALEPRIP